MLKNLTISEPRRRNPEIIIFEVDRTLPDREIINAVLEQNEAIYGASLELRTTLREREVATRSCRWTSTLTHYSWAWKGYNMIWYQTDFRLNDVCWFAFKCWKTDHTQKVCRSASQSGTCGVSDHPSSKCSDDPVWLTASKGTYSGRMQVIVN